MATHAGSEGKVFIGSDQVAEIKSWSLEITSDTVDASIIGTQWRKNQATIKGWSGSFEGFWDETDTNGQGALSAERLKEFGIKAKSQGDQVTFTFQGVSTTVGKNSREIEAYLRSIGDVQFAGAMEEQADTLNVSL
jgi:hypothetical protein